MAAAQPYDQPHLQPHQDLYVRASDSRASSTHLTYASTETAGYEATKNDVYREQMLQESSPITQRSTQHIWRCWTWEILSLIVAIGLISAIVAILIHYEGQKVPEWPFAINLNTLIALLATILRAAMLVAVAEVIGQIKWTYFSRPHPLTHLHDFDRASRSVNGSIKLLFIAPTNYLAMIGAIVMILSLAVGPFTQQAIKTTTCPQFVSNANASLPVAHFIPGNALYYRIAAGEWEVDVDMKGAMINGLVNPTGNDSAIAATCSTGNCTFPVQTGDITHSSIGMCSACMDTTSFVTGNGNGTNYTMPNNLWLDPLSGSSYLNVAVGSLAWANSQFPDGFAEISRNALTNVTVLSFTKASCTNDTQGKFTCPHNVTGYYGVSDYVATSCAIYPCLKNFNADISRGMLTERVVSTAPAPVNWVEADIPENSLGSSVVANYTALKAPCLIDHIEYDQSNFSAVPHAANRTWTGVNVDGKNYTVPDECLYKLEWLYGEALTYFMGTVLFKGKCVYDSRQGGSLWCGDSWWLSPFYREANATFDSISTQFDQYATALTNKFRQVGSSNSHATMAERALGAVIETTVCTGFDWRWLWMPIILLSASATILIIMIARNYREPRQPVWKSSVLPLLFHGIRGQSLQMESKPTMELDQMKDQAHHIRTKFYNGPNAGFMHLSNDGGRTRDIDMDSLLEQEQ